MAYTINKFNGDELTQVLDATINTATDLKLVGKNFAGYGEVQNENFVFLLENFSNNTSPENPIKGQLWHDSTNNKVKFYDGNDWNSLGIIQSSGTEPGLASGDIWFDINNNRFRLNIDNEYKTIGIIEVEDSMPSEDQEGNLWYDTDKDQLYAYNGTAYDLIGPQRAGDEPTLFVSEVVKDTLGNNQALIKGVVNGENILLVSENEFTISPSTPVTGFNKVYKGVTLQNDTNGSTDQNNTWFWGTASEANKLDGLEATQFLRSDENTSLTGTLSFTDNNTGLEWNNDIKIVNVGDRLDLQVGNTGSVRFSYTDGISSFDLLEFSSNNTDDALQFRNNTVWHAGNHGAGSGLDADKLDGLDSTDFLRANAKAVDSDKLDGLDSSAYLQKIGGTMTGNIQFIDSGEGIVWSRDSDSASIKFYSTSDGDTSTRLEFQTSDNENEYFLWTHKPSGSAAIELMRLSPTDNANGLTFRNNTVWHEGNDGAGSTLDADTVDGKHASEFLGVNETAAYANNADKVDGLDASDFMRVTGGSFTGFVSLVDDPAQGLHAATKSYVDTKVSQVGIPGEVSYFAMQNAPTGWLKANGAEVSRSSYANLFAAIGTRFGTGNGSTTFNLPDLRGEFIRGWDDGRGVDSGRSFGSFQADEFRSHNHPLIGNDRGTFGSQLYASGLFKDDAERVANDPDSIGYRGGDETRPRNVALLACIKY